MALSHRIGKKHSSIMYCARVNRYASKWEYVRSNPVRAGFVGEPDDWPFMGRIYPLEFGRD